MISNAVTIQDRRGRSMTGCCSSAGRARCLQDSLHSLQRYLIGVVALSVGWVTYNFITVVLREIAAAEGTAVASAYLAWGLWLLFNIVYNYTMALLRSPGCTLDIDPEVLRAAMTYGWKWCMRCNAPKPPRSHHCSMCNRCILLMDHHCLWVASCIGHGNYRHFFLFTLYLCLGSGYAAIVTAQRFSVRFATYSGRHVHEGALMQCILSAAVCAMLVPLLAWHVVVICTGIGTLGLMEQYFGIERNRDRQKLTVELQEQGAANDHGSGSSLLRQQQQRQQQQRQQQQRQQQQQQQQQQQERQQRHGRLHCRERLVENWRRVFNVHGRLWWLLWLLPSSRPPHGTGFDDDAQYA